MAARAPVMAVLPEQRRDGVRIECAIALITVAARAKTEGPLLPASAKAPRGAFDASARVSDEPIGAEFQDQVVRRLVRWGLTKRWLTRVGVSNPKPASPISWWGPSVLNGNVEQIGLESMRDVCPWDLDEARETDLCVNALPGHLSSTVIEEYMHNGDRERKAWRLGIDDRTMRRRLSQAHILLLELFNCAAANLPLECSYQGPGRPERVTS